MSLTWWKHEPLRRLCRNAGVLLSGHAVAAVLALVSLALTARGLGAEPFAILVLISTYVLIVDRLVNFESWQALIKYGAEALARRDADRFRGLIKFGTILDAASASAGALIAAAGAALAGWWMGWDPAIVMIAVVYSVTILTNLSGVPTAVLRLYDRFRLLAALQVTASGAKLVGVLIVYLSGGGLWAFALAWLGSTVLYHVLLLAVGHVILAREGVTGWRRAPLGDWRKPLAFTFWTNITSTFDLPVKQFDIVLVSAVVSLEAVGVYKIIKQTAQVMSRFAHPVHQAIFPQVAAQVAAGRGAEACGLAARVGALLLGLVAPIALVAGLSSPWWLAGLFGPEYATGAAALTVYFAFTALSIGFIAIHPLFLALGYARANAFLLLTSNAAYLLIAWALGTAYGLMGVAVAFGVAVVIVSSVKTAIILIGQAQEKKPDAAAQTMD